MPRQPADAPRRSCVAAALTKPEYDAVMARARALGMRQGDYVRQLLAQEIPEVRFPSNSTVKPAA